MVVKNPSCPELSSGQRVAVVAILPEGPLVLGEATVVSSSRQGQDVHYVLAVPEGKEMKIDFHFLPEEDFDNLMGRCTGGAVIFGATGGVMEAAVRTVYYFITGQEPPPAPLLNFSPVRGLDKVKEASVEIPGAGNIRVAVVHGMGAAREVLQAVRQGRAPWHFIELMGCPGGCQSGGGQLRTSVPPNDEIRSARINSLYVADST